MHYHLRTEPGTLVQNNYSIPFSYDALFALRSRLSLADEHLPSAARSFQFALQEQNPSPALSSKSTRGHSLVFPVRRSAHTALGRSGSHKVDRMLHHSRGSSTDVRADTRPMRQTHSKKKRAYTHISTHGIRPVPAR